MSYNNTDLYVAGQATHELVASCAIADYGVED